MLSSVLKLSLSFLSSRFPIRPKSQDKELNILREKKKEIKSIFHHFKGLSVSKNYLRPGSTPLKLKISLNFINMLGYIYIYIY